MNTYQESQNIGLQVLNNLYQNSWDSPEFKERLIRNPSTTIEEVVGHSISPYARFIVEDQSNSSIIYLNIPAKVDLDSLELSDEQLEQVSGGDVVLIAAGIIIGGAIVCAGAGMLYGYLTSPSPSPAPAAVPAGKP